MTSPGVHQQETEGERWHGFSLESAALAWEKATGCDSVDTIRRVYPQTRGAYKCLTPGCSFTCRDAEAMWRHVHTAHGRSDLPPDDFDPGPYW